jgi:hypothetical protein
MFEPSKTEANNAVFVEDKERSLEETGLTNIDGGLTLKQQRSIRRRASLRTAQVDIRHQPG